MILKTILLFSTMVLSFTSLQWASAEEPRQGCLVKTKNKVLLDPECKCLEKKLCAAPVKILYKEENFSRRDPVTGHDVYSDKEKQLHKDSYETYNKIMLLKSQGLGDSAEIKEHYAKLNKLDQAILESYKKNHPVAHKLIMSSKEKAVKKLAKKLKVKPESVSYAPAPESTPSEKLADSKKVEKVQEVKAIEPAPVEVKAARAVAHENNLSKEDKKNIINNIKSGDYEKNEDDSLFDIISKTYKGKAYKKLLEEKEE